MLQELTWELSLTKIKVSKSHQIRLLLIVIGMQNNHLTILVTQNMQVDRSTTKTCAAGPNLRTFLKSWWHENCNMINRGRRQVRPSISMDFWKKMTLENISIGLNQTQEYGLWSWGGIESPHWSLMGKLAEDSETMIQCPMNRGWCRKILPSSSSSLFVNWVCKKNDFTKKMKLALSIQ